MRILKLAILVFLAAAALPAAKTLEVFVVDVEGGKAMIVVAPSGESMLVDAGWPGFNGRDAARIAEAAAAAGVKQFDYLVMSHYDVDHVGGTPALVAKVPVKTFIDHGEDVQTGERDKKMMADYAQAIGASKHIVVKPGDKIPIKGMDVIVLTSAGANITAPVKGGGAPNPACQETKPMTWTGNNEDASENAVAIGLLYTFGKFRMLDLADITWNKEVALMCPKNPIGTVDLLMMSHHGYHISSSPALVKAIHAKAAIMNNGARKFGETEPMQAVRNAPGMQDFWQLHYSTVSAKEANAPDDYIANLEGTPDGKWIQVSAREDGAFTVTNQRNGKTVTYKK
jgi:beta-lactamase superfamily II metal-dependent hydrolase